MFEDNDHKYLKRAISRNEAILFLGSGFSRGAINRLGENFPTGWVLGKKIWDFLEFPGEYDSTLLPEMYQAFLSVGKKKNVKSDFLEKNLLSKEIPDQYNYISKPYWYKIYTLNIDDILSRVFNRNNKKIDEVIYPNDEYRERDQSLEQTFIVYPHGKLPCDPEDVIFSVKQYAKSQLKHQPLYSQFVYDYATKPTIFVGTDLNEPLFESYIESREGKGGYAELRPKSFLITPSLSPIRALNLKKNYNVHHVKGTTDDFLNWLSSIIQELPSKVDILKTTFPGLLSVMEFADVANVSPKSVKAFAETFKRVPNVFNSKNERSAFLHGASPRWNDIAQELDIPRNIGLQLHKDVDELLSSLNKDSKIHVITIVGTAGSGKSTLLKRLGLQLSQNGRTVFLSYSDAIPRAEYLVDVLRAINERVVLMFDNAYNALSSLPNLISFLNTLKNPPVILLSLRSNHSERVDHVLDSEIVDIKKYLIPNLEDTEILN